jgi:putative ABC transport system permease protein
MTGLLHDLRFAVRMLLKSPGYTIVAVFTLALAIGANTAIFSAVNSILLRPLPFHQPDRLYLVTESLPEFGSLPVSYLNWLDYRAGTTAFSGLGAAGRTTMTMTGQAEPERLIADLYSHEVMTVIGVEPALGRDFLPEEDGAGGPKAVILTHGLWTRRFAADPAVLGKTLTLDRTPWTVVGVMPPGHEFVFGGNDIILPLGSQADIPHFRDRNARATIFLVGRLADGVTPEQADADLQTVGQSLAARFPADYATCRPAMISLADDAVTLHRPGLLLLMGAVLSVLLIAAANVANLMLGRAMARQREMAIRAAVGAGRWRLVRQLLVESVLLALVAGGLGLLLALWGVDVLTALRPQLGTAMFGPITVDTTVLAFTVGIALGTGLLFGLVPAIYASRQDLAQALKDADIHASAAAGHLRARNVLVVLEVALALALLVTAVLALRGLVQLQAHDPGFAADDLLHARITHPAGRFKTMAESRQFWTELRRQLAALPGVTAATITSGAPIVGASFAPLSADGEPVGLATSRIVIAYVGDEHLIPTLQVPLLAGRTFGPQDTAGTTPVLVINKALADEFFPGQDPIGRRLHDDLSKLPGIEVVGVVADVTHFPPGGMMTNPYQIYYATAQLPDTGDAQIESCAVVLRGHGDPRALVPQLRATLAAIDPNLPLDDVTTFLDKYAAAFKSRRYTTTLLGAFAGLALVLAAVGLYAVMASTVARRTHELGVRMALGARPRAVVLLVVRQGMALVALGLAFGLLGAHALTTLLATRIAEALSGTGTDLYAGLSTTDPVTHLGVALLLALVGLLATWLPARRATRIDPMIALRHD